MNHDYSHCLDFNDSCPKKCFRAELVRDLRSRKDIVGVPISWTHYKGTDECPKKTELIRCKDCKHHCYVNKIPYCNLIDYGYGWEDNDFCSRAERKEE